MSHDPDETPADEYQRRLEERRTSAMAAIRRRVVVWLWWHSFFTACVVAGLRADLPFWSVAPFWLATGALGGFVAVPAVRDWPALSSVERVTGFIPVFVALAFAALTGVIITGSVLSKP